METDLLKKVRKIEIKAKGLSRNIFSGEYHSAFKGKGMAFSEVREYQYGDDIRNIDWNVTARFNRPYVKIFEEERELTVMLLVDVSGSTLFGTQKQFKKDVLVEIAAILSFSAIQNNDKVGVIFFSNKVEKYIPPKKGTSHILRIIRELLTFEPTEKGTNIQEPLRFLTNVVKKKCTCFLLSDFMDEGYADALQIASKKHDPVAIRITDEREKTLPNMGLVKIQDQETGKQFRLDTTDPKTRRQYETYYKRKEQEVIAGLRRSGIDFTDIHTGTDYIKPLIMLFDKRESRY